MSYLYGFFKGNHIMWKDLFYFTKGEKNAVFILILLIVLIFVFTVIRPYLFTSNEAGIDYDRHKNEYLSFIDSLTIREKKLAYDKKTYYSARNIPVQLFEFNPNTIDSASFTRL